MGQDHPILSLAEYSSAKKKGQLPKDCYILLGKNCGKEISLSKKGGARLSLDWVMARISSDTLHSMIPCEVQSIDTTGNYRATWHAYAKELTKIPNSEHNMNWANVWKRLIPQLILKSHIASTSKLCKHGIYFVLPDRVYIQFEKLVGTVPTVRAATEGTLSVMTYGLGPEVAKGQIRKLASIRTIHMRASDFATAFSSGRQLPTGTQLDEKVAEYIATL